MSAEIIHISVIQGGYLCLMDQGERALSRYTVDWRFVRQGGQSVNGEVHRSNGFDILEEAIDRYIAAFGDELKDQLLSDQIAGGA